MSRESVKDGMVRALRGREAQPAARVATAKVSSVSGACAKCVLAGDASALTSVELAGHACKAGQTLAVVGQAGRWYAIGVIG